jgi:hypothetical protein
MRHSFKRSAPGAMIWIKARIGVAKRGGPPAPPQANDVRGDPPRALRRQINSKLVLTPIKVIQRRIVHQNNIDRGLQTNASTPANEIG